MHGVDPNQAYQRSTPWKDVIIQAISDSKLEDRHPYYNILMGRWAEVIEIFISYGADVEVDRKTECVAGIREAFWNWNIGRAKGLKEMVLKRSEGTRKSSRFSRLFSRRKG